MGMIWIVRKSVMSHLAYKRIPRKKIRTDEKAKLLKAGEVTILKCKDPEKSGIDKTTLMPMNELLNNVAKEKLHISHGDTQWEAGWILQREMNVTHPHWSPDG